MSSASLPRRQRQVHLDFHTSPFIPDVASEFDAESFARTLSEAHVNSVTIFAKCHHGMSYYPTKVGAMHPALQGRDLMGEMIEALHRKDIRCPIYTTVAWEEDAAQKHPEWRQINKKGAFAEQAATGDLAQPGKWKFNNFLHPDYQDYIEAHVREILTGYDTDGIFFDIVFFAKGTCWSDSSVKFREKHGLLGDDHATQARFGGAAQSAFAQRFSRLIHGLAPKASIFYNASNDSNIDPDLGPHSRLREMTHLEIESLPSGFWGYLHFPRMARLQSHWGKFWFGMTGRFQKMWGDFGGIKPQAALEFECFRSQALGGGNSVGDQLPPRGTLDPAAYRLIGSVFQQTAKAEPFYEDSTAIPQVGILSPNYPGVDGGLSEEGAVQMTEESHYDAMVCDSLSDLKGLDLVILPDSTVVTPQIKKLLAAFHKRGGKLIISHRAGFDPEGHWALDFLPLSFHGAVEKYPTYWRVRKSFSPDLAEGDRVFYAAGLNVRGGKGTKVLADRVLPYFQRTDLTFSSHFQTPPVAGTDKYPAIIGGPNFIYFADPIFREYRQTGNMAARNAWKKAMRDLVGPAPFGEGLPSTVLSYPLRKGNDLLLTLLHYVPMRKALDIDIIEDRQGFGGLTLSVANAKNLEIWPEGEHLPSPTAGEFTLPSRFGRLLLRAPGYFRKGKAQS